MSDGDYWRRFAHTASFLEPCEVMGWVRGLDELNTADGPTPRLTLETPDGLTLIVNAVQKRLIAELVKLAPRVGDKIQITYHGTAKRAAPGMSPTKEFSVAVWPQKPLPPERTSGENAFGEVPGENAPEAGK